MMLLGPRYKELLTDIFRRHKLADDFSLYLHRPTASDASHGAGRARHLLRALPGTASGQRHRLGRPGRAYAPRRGRGARPHRVADLEQAHRASFITTPQDFHDRLLSFKGAAFGLEPLLMQSAWFRPHNRSEDVKHLYLVGAGTHPGAGIPGVLTLR
jgi:phytoene desaturase